MFPCMQQMCISTESPNPEGEPPNQRSSRDIQSFFWISQGAPITLLPSYFS